MIFSSCHNPFSPDIAFDTSNQNSGLSDLSTVDGVFQNLQYAYTFKDTLIYGALLSQDFIFNYRDYDLGFDVSWGRDDEMHVTHGLFRNAERLDLIWNNKLFSTLDSSKATIVRSFNLTVTFNPNDIVRIDGRANLQLLKGSDNRWQISRWIDESNF